MAGGRTSDRWWRILRCMVVGATLSSALALGLPSARATYVSDLTGTSAVMTGDGADDFLNIQRDISGVLAHDRFPMDPGYAGPDDWDTAEPGSQLLGVTGNLTVDAGGGFDNVDLNAGPLSALTGALVFDGGAADDNLSVNNGDEVVGRTIGVGSTGITGLGGGPLSYSAFEHLGFVSGRGDDTITVGASLPQGVDVSAGEGDDTLKPGAGLANSSLDGGPGVDTLDISASSRDALVDIGQREQFGGEFSGGNVVPPVASLARGFAGLALERDTGNFFFAADQCGIDVNDITASHIHVGAPGINDSDFDGLLTLQWSGDPSCSGTATGAQPFPTANLPDLRAGNVYVDVHTAAFPGSELRAQLTFQGYSGGGPGYGLQGIEGILGSSFDDILIGSDGDNTINGKALDDVLIGHGGADQLTGGAGADTLSGGAGADTLFSAGDGSIDQVRCGPGFDTVTADDDDTVAADCESVVDTTPPQSEITKPVHGKTYGRARIRTFAGSAADAGAGVDEVEVALRRRKTNGSCAWWNGASFVSGDCNAKLFVDATGAESWTYELSKQLKPSIGTNVKDYTLYSRATDLQANVESAFENGRNANRFEVRP